MVHGIASDGSRWEPLLPMLKPRFQIYMMDRRGRGASSDTPPYAIEREFDDVAAVINSIDRPVAVVGHGFGALCALEAALRSDNVRKLVLFEPPTRASGLEFYPNGAIDRLEQLLEQGRREEVVTYLLRDMLGVSLDELERMQRQVVWQRRLAAAPTIPRELRAQAGYTFNPSRFRALGIPALVLVGARSPEAVQQQAGIVADALRPTRKIELADQGCAAIDSAPGLFVREVVEFLRDTW
jgi:pimeloyl-ACP methyl ester carboxylesterase